jgi:hypothetical protein
MKIKIYNWMLIDKMIKMSNNKLNIYKIKEN